jgi:hypothetical protein
VILAVAQLSQTRDHHGEVVWITGLQLVQELQHRATSRHGLIKLYSEIHRETTSILMYMAKKQQADSSAPRTACALTVHPELVEAFFEFRREPTVTVHCFPMSFCID